MCKSIHWQRITLSAVVAHSWSEMPLWECSREWGGRVGCWSKPQWAGRMCWSLHFLHMWAAEVNHSELDACIELFTSCAWGLLNQLGKSKTSTVICPFKERFISGLGMFDNVCLSAILRRWNVVWSYLLEVDLTYWVITFPTAVQLSCITRIWGQKLNKPSCIFDLNNILILSRN